MPMQYERIKESEKKAGKSDAEAKRIAAATYNKNRPKGAPPVTRNYDKTKRGKKNEAKAKQEIQHKKVLDGLKRAFPGS